MTALNLTAADDSAHLPSVEDGCASEASAGLVSFSNKGNVTLADAEKHHRRMWRMQRGVIAAARLVHNQLVEEGIRFRSALVTLTYRPDVEWQPGHIGALIRHYRQWSKRRGFKFRAVWKMEPHVSGRPHYHIVFWMPRGITPPMPDKQGWWPHGMTNAKWARSPVGYIAKYVAKPADDVFPKGARIWGAVGLSVSERCRVQWSVAPRWLRRMTDPAHGVRRLRRSLRILSFNFKDRGGVYCNADSKDSADWRPSLWTCMRSGFSFEAPNEVEGFSNGGLVLVPRERPRCWSSEGEQFFYKAA